MVLGYDILKNPLLWRVRNVDSDKLILWRIFVGQEVELCTIVRDTEKASAYILACERGESRGYLLLIICLVFNNYFVPLHVLSNRIFLEVCNPYPIFLKIVTIRMSLSVESGAKCNIREQYPVRLSR